MILIAILISVSALRVFSELFILSGGKGGPGGRDNSVVMLIQQYSQGFEGNLGYASALSIVLFFVTVVPMLVLARHEPEGGRRMSVVTDPARPVAVPDEPGTAAAAAEAGDVRVQLDVADARRWSGTCCSSSCC